MVEWTNVAAMAAVMAVIGGAWWLAVKGQGAASEARDTGLSQAITQQGQSLSQAITQQSQSLSQAITQQGAASKERTDALRTAIDAHVATDRQIVVDIGKRIDDLRATIHAQEASMLAAIQAQSDATNRRIDDLRGDLGRAPRIAAPEGGSS